MLNKWSGFQKTFAVLLAVLIIEIGLYTARQPLPSVHAQNFNITTQTQPAQFADPQSTATNTATLIVPQVFGTLTGTPTGAATYTTPTAAAICAALGNNAGYGLPGTQWYWDVTQGATTFAITVAGGAGVTLVGSGTDASASTRQFKWTVKNCTVGSEALTLNSLNTSLR